MSIEDRFKTVHPGNLPDKENRMDYAGSSVHSDYDALNHKDNLGVSLEDLRGKKTLDIGGTINGTFAREAKEAGVDLITFNPYSDIGGYTWGLEAVKGLAQQMPFEKNTFDIELALGSVPVYLPNYESEYKNTFTEIIRTLKKGGRAIIFPVTGEMYTSEIFKTVIKELETAANFDFEDEGVYNKTIGGEEKTAHFYRLTITKK